MNCREFRRNHVAFVDRMMDEWSTGEMYGHLGQCGRCERLDIAVRRGLLVARNLPLIQPSTDFVSRLEARLRDQDGIVTPIGQRGLRAHLGVVTAVIAITAVVAVGLSKRPPALDTGSALATVQDSQFSGLRGEVFTVAIPAAERVEEPEATIRLLGSIVVSTNDLSP